MAQTTGGISMVANYVAISSNGSSFTDVSGEANAIESPELARAAGELFTFDGDTPIVKAGKLAAVDVTVKLVYSELTASAFETLRGYLQTAGGQATYVRWAPKGNTTGNFQFTTGASVITKMNLPGGEAESGEPVAVSFTVHAPSVTKAVVA